MGAEDLQYIIYIMTWFKTMVPHVLAPDAWGLCAFPRVLLERECGPIDVCLAACQVG